MRLDVGSGDEARDRVSVECNGDVAPAPDPEHLLERGRIQVDPEQLGLLVVEPELEPELRRLVGVQRGNGARAPPPY